jgi:hypothetical protein
MVLETIAKNQGFDLKVNAYLPNARLASDTPMYINIITGIAATFIASNSNTETPRKVNRTLLSLQE